MCDKEIEIFVSFVGSIVNCEKRNKMIKDMFIDRIDSMMKLSLNFVLQKQKYRKKWLPCI